MQNVIFLKNQKGKVHLQPTGPVAVSHRFYEAFKNIEEEYDYNKDQFQFRKDGRGRLIHHLTKADIQLFITVQVGFNTQGSLEFVNRNQIYTKQVELFEDPVTNDQFYAAFNKFVDLGLIEYVKEEITGKYHYVLKQYLEPKTGKIGRYFLLSPVVFSKAFTQLPLAAQKWFLDAVAQQGDHRDKIVEKNLRNDGKDGGLYRFLHKTDLYQVRALIDILTKTPIMEGQGLFAIITLEKNTTGYYKAQYSINPFFWVKKEEKSQYHDIIKPKKTYRRLIQEVQSMLTEFGIGELEYHNDGQTFFQLMTLLKKKSHSFIRYVLLKIKELHERHNIFPLDIISFIKEEIRNQGIAKYLDIAKKTGVYKFIAPNRRDDIGERFYDFASEMSRVDLNTFRKICKAALPMLDKHYAMAPVMSPSEYMRYWEGDVLGPWIGHANAKQVHSYAYQMQVDINEYRYIENHAINHMQHEDPHKVKLWLMDQIEALPKWELIPDVPQGFKLEEFLLQNFHTLVA